MALSLSSPLRITGPCYHPKPTSVNAVVFTRFHAACEWEASSRHMAMGIGPQGNKFVGFHGVSYAYVIPRAIHSILIWIVPGESQKRVV